MIHLQEEVQQPMLLLPTRHLLHQIRKRLLQQQPGVIDLKLVTFDDIARSILHDFGVSTVALERYGRQKLLRRLLHQYKNDARIACFRDWIDSDGLLHSLLHHIGEIKRSGYSASEWKRQILSLQSADCRKEHAIAFLYEKYQEALYDEPGIVFTDPEELLVLAHRFLTQERMDELESLHLGLLTASEWSKPIAHLFVDHFTDFTPLQMKLLTALIARSREAEVRFPFHPDDYEGLPHLREHVKQVSQQFIALGLNEETINRSNHKTFCFSKRTEVAGEIAFASAVEMEDGLTELVHLRANFMKPVKEKLTALQHTEVFRACHPKREIERISKEIKRLIYEEQISPANIALLIRDDATYRIWTEEIFKREGIHSTLSKKIKLHEVPFIRQLMALFRVEMTGWHRDTMLKLADGSYISWVHPPISGLAGWVKKVAIIDGKETWLRRIDFEHKQLEDRLIRMEYDGIIASNILDDESEAADSETLEQEKEQLRQRMDRMDRLKAWVEEVDDKVQELGMNRPRTINDWLQRIEQMLSDLRFSDKFEELRQLQGYTPESYKRDTLALQKLESMLQIMRQTVSWLKLDEILSWSEIFTDLESQLRQQEIIVDEGVDEGVRILDPSAARGDRFDTVFVAGLNEGRFPLHHKENWLFDDESRQHVAQGSVLLPASHFHNEMEQLFLLMTMSMPRRRFILSYVSPEADEKSLPSAYMEWFFDSVEAGAWKHPAKYEDAMYSHVLPSDPQSISHRSEYIRWRLQSAASLRTEPNFAEEPAAPFQVSIDFWPTIKESLQVERIRREGTFGKWDGCLEDAEIHRHLSELFSGERKYSVSLLNEAATCPFRFFLARVLGIRPLEEGRDEITPLEKGNLLHEVLRQLFQRHRGERMGVHLLSPLQDELRDIFLAECAKLERISLFSQSPIWPLEKQRLLKQLLSWLRNALSSEKDSEFRPAFFEFSFGLPLSDGVDEASSEEPIFVSIGGESLPFYGRIDRVDMDDQGYFIIYDYKLNLNRYRGLQDIVEGVHYQLPIYLAAFGKWLSEHRGIQARAAGAGFYSLEPKDKTKKKGLWDKGRIAEIGVSSRNRGALDDLQPVVDQALEDAAQLMERIRKGAYHFLPHHQPDYFYADQRVYRIDKVKLVQRAKKQSNLLT